MTMVANSFISSRNFFFAIITALGIGWWIVSAMCAPDVWDEVSSDIVRQVRSLDETLAPGGEGRVNVPACDADELIFLPAYCERKAIVRRFPNRPVAFYDSLTEILGGDRVCPAFLWLRNSEVISINTARFGVAFNEGVASWRAGPPFAIIVSKESKSENPFLSLSFRDDGRP